MDLLQLISLLFTALQLSTQTPRIKLALLTLQPSAALKGLLLLQESEQPLKDLQLRGSQDLNGTTS